MVLVRIPVLKVKAFRVWSAIPAALLGDGHMPAELSVPVPFGTAAHEERGCSVFGQLLADLAGILQGGSVCFPPQISLVEHVDVIGGCSLAIIFPFLHLACAGPPACCLDSELFDAAANGGGVGGGMCMCVCRLVSFDTKARFVERVHYMPYEKNFHYRCRVEEKLLTDVNDDSNDKTAVTFF